MLFKPSSSLFNHVTSVTYPLLVAVWKQSQEMIPHLVGDGKLKIKLKKNVSDSWLYLVRQLKDTPIKEQCTLVTRRNRSEPVYLEQSAIDNYFQDFYFYRK